MRLSGSLELQNVYVIDSKDIIIINDIYLHSIEVEVHYNYTYLSITILKESGDHSYYTRSIIYYIPVISDCT